MPPPLCDGGLVVARDVQDLSGPAGRQGVGTQKGNPLTGDGFVDLPFVLAKVVPVSLLQPGRVTRNPQPVITSDQCLIEYCVPAAGDSLQIKNAVFEVPLAEHMHLQTALSHVLIKAGNSPSQSFSDFLLRQGVGNYPYTELVVFQTDFEIEN